MQLFYAVIECLGGLALAAIGVAFLCGGVQIAMNALERGY